MCFLSTKSTYGKYIPWAFSAGGFFLGKMSGFFSLVCARPYLPFYYWKRFTVFFTVLFFYSGNNLGGGRRSWLDLLLGELFLRRRNVCKSIEWGETAACFVLHQCFFFFCFYFCGICPVWFFSSPAALEQKKNDNNDNTQATPPLCYWIFFISSGKKEKEDKIFV